MLSVFLKNDQEKKKRHADKNDAVDSDEDVAKERRDQEFEITRSSPLHLESPYPVIVDGKEWKTAFAYIEAQRYPGTDLAQKIFECSNPSLVRYLTRKIKVYDSATNRLRFAVKYNGAVVMEDPSFNIHDVTMAIVKKRFRRYKFMSEKLNGITRVKDTDNPHHEDVLNEMIVEKK